MTEKQKIELIQKRKLWLRKMDKLMDEMKLVINELPLKGNTPNTCQRMQLLNDLLQISYSVNGTALIDFIENEDDETNNH